jgi:mannose-6-phosphate isomerase
MNNLYPLRFIPIFKERIWGGNKLKQVLGKDIQTDLIGESWELSDVEGDVSIVQNGELKGQSLREVLKKYKGKLVGQKNYQKFGDSFPLLIKFIDAREDLSIQVHPDDALALKRHQTFGKTEMWYVMQAEKDAKLIVGFEKSVNKETYQKSLENNSLTELLHYEPVHAGDTFFIKTGTIHAIGAGILLAEIQQTSDITYRVYDFNRKDKNGNTRELHTELALDAINYSGNRDFKADYTKVLNQSNEMVACPYFVTRLLPVSGEVNLDLTAQDSFKIYLVVSGEVRFTSESDTQLLKTGEIILIPANQKSIVLKGEKADILEVYVPD